jgi:Flp pilus assembly pilin Flp
MSQMFAWINSCRIGSLQAEDGQTLTEYGMLLAVIVIVVVAVAVLLGQDVANLLFKTVTNLF